MAIYVPGAPQYFPEYKPFTPDFKFIADVLERRSDKYITNFNALNKQYNQVVYGNLSREDTNAARERFVNALGPKLEVVSGMDLSLAENVNAAKGLFEPFYSNDKILFDMMYTKSAQNVQKQYDITKRSLDEKVNDNYYAIGEMGLKLRMDDFKNLPIEEAMQMQMPQFVANPQLYKRGQAYLESKGYNVVIEEAPEGSFYKIKTKNGDNITEIATNDLILALGDDPIIQRGYAEQSFVEARLFANDLVEKGQVESVSEGENVWSNAKLTDMILKARDKVEEEKAVLTEMAKKKQYYEELYQKGKAPIPGSPDDVLAQSLMAKYAAVQQMYERDSKLLSKLDEASRNPDLSQKLNQTKAYQMQANLEADFKQAALMFSERNKEITLEVNEEEKFKRQKEFDLFKMRQKFEYDKTLKAIDFEYDKVLKDIEFENKKKIEELKGTILPPTPPLMIPGTALTYQNGQITVVTDPSQVFDAVGANMAVQSESLDRVFDQMLSMLLKSESTNGVVNQTGIFGQYIKGQNLNNIDDVKNYLKTKYSTDKDFQGFVLDQFKFRANTPEAQTIYENYDILENAVSQQNEVYLNNFNNLLTFDDRFNEMFVQNNLPIPFDEEGNLLTNFEYKKLLDEKAANGEINEEFVREVVPGVYRQHPTEDNMWELTHSQITSPSLRRPAGVEFMFGSPQNFYVLPSAEAERTQDGTLHVDSEMLIKADSEENVRTVAIELAKRYPDLKIVSRTNPGSIPKTFSPISTWVVRPLGFADRDLPNNSLYFTSLSGETFSFDEIYERYLADEFGITGQSSRVPTSLYPMFAQDPNINPTGEPTMTLNVRGSSFALKQGDGVQSKADRIYSDIVGGLNRTLTGNITLNDGAQQTVTFQNYNLQSAIAGEDPSAQVGDVFLSEQVVFGGSQSYMRDPRNIQHIQAMKLALQDPTALIYDLNSIEDDVRMPTIINKLEMGDAYNAITNALTGDPKLLNGYTFKYNNVDPDPNNPNMASYEIYDTKSVEKGDPAKVYKIVFDIKNDRNQQRLQYFNRFNPLLIKITKGQTHEDISYLSDDNPLAEPVPGMRIMFKKEDQMIYISTIKYGLDENNQITEDDPVAVINPETNKPGFMVDQYEYYNKVIESLRKSGRFIAETNYTSKYRQRDNYNRTNK